jgi:hypothetical protein
MVPGVPDILRGATSTVRLLLSRKLLATVRRRKEAMRMGKVPDAEGRPFSWWREITARDPEDLPASQLTAVDSETHGPHQRLSFNGCSNRKGKYLNIFTFLAHPFDGTHREGGTHRWLWPTNP